MWRAFLGPAASVRFLRLAHREARRLRQLGLLHAPRDAGRLTLQLRQDGGQLRVIVVFVACSHSKALTPREKVLT